MYSKKESALLEVLNGQWGTIGPKSLSCAQMAADRFGCPFGLALHSASAALEAALRSLEISYGDEVIMASYSDPMDSLVTAAIGATPVFADIDLVSGVINAWQVERKITEKTKAVIVDAMGGNAFDAKLMKAICEKYGVKFILNLEDGYDTTFDGKPLAQYAFATVLSLADGNALSAGEGGLLILNDEKSYKNAFGYHNCGRVPGEGSTLTMNDDIIGGDLRITDFQATLAEVNMAGLDIVLLDRQERATQVAKQLNYKWLTPLVPVDNGHSSKKALIFKYNTNENDGLPIEDAIQTLCQSGLKACRPWCAMHRQPVFSSEYFKGITGYTGSYSDDEVKGCIQAEENFIWILI